jgi:hypothetical protein
MNKSKRHIVAWFGILAIVLAQFVAAAHACTLRYSAASERKVVAQTADATFAAMAAAHHCGAHDTTPVTPAANLCEVHCAGVATPVTPLDPPQVSQAPLPVPEIMLVTLAEVAARGCNKPASAPGNPQPLNLQFCRLLI